MVASRMLTGITSTRQAAFRPKRSRRLHSTDTRSASFGTLKVALDALTLPSFNNHDQVS